MKLVVETLLGELQQEINYSSDFRSHIGAIIPYFYFHNLSSGVFRLEVTHNNLIIFEQDFDWEDIKGSGGNYQHIFFPIVPVNPIQIKSGIYVFKIRAISDYEANGNSFLGWIKQHEDIQLPMDYQPLSDAQNTFTIRFKEYKNGIE